MRSTSCVGVNKVHCGCCTSQKTTGGDEDVYTRSRSPRQCRLVTHEFKATTVEVPQAPFRPDPRYRPTSPCPTHRTTQEIIWQEHRPRTPRLQTKGTACHSPPAHTCVTALHCVLFTLNRCVFTHLHAVQPVSVPMPS